MKLVKDKDTEQLQKKAQKVSDEKAEEAVRTIIEWIGESPDREGLKSTPKRVIKAYGSSLTASADIFLRDDSA